MGSQAFLKDIAARHGPEEAARPEKELVQQLGCMISTDDGMRVKVLKHTVSLACLFLKHSYGCLAEMSP